MSTAPSGAGSPAPSGARSADPSGTVFLFDVDNTLLDNDRAKRVLDERIRRAVGDPGALRFWALYEAVRAALDQVDVPETVHRLGRELGDAAALARLSDAVYGLDFAAQLLPGAREGLAHARALGLTVLLSDGDQRFQRHKIRAAGLEAMVGGRVLITAHKERETEAIRARYPAAHYVLVDDKPGLLAAMKAQLGAGLTTVLVEQGKYALDPEAQRATPPPDLRLASIADFATLTPEALRIPRA